MDQLEINHMAVRINHRITNDIKQELILQGHKDTGALEASIEEREFFEGTTLVLEGWALDYLQALEEGIPASKIISNEQQSERLIEWILSKRIASSRKNAERIAGAIIHKWMKEGMPTENSKQFSQTGERLHAVDIAIQKNADSVLDDLGVFIDKLFPITNEEI